MFAGEAGARSDVVFEGAGDHSLAWMRVLTTSRGKVASQPTTPAIPPEMSRAGQDKECASCFITEITEELSAVDDRCGGEENNRHDNSYLVK